MVHGGQRREDPPGQILLCTPERMLWGGIVEPKVPMLDAMGAIGNVLGTQNNLILENIFSGLYTRTQILK